jgi:hypothetical protein
MTLDKKYDEVMEHLEVTSEMRQRILGNIQKIDITANKSAKVIPFSVIKGFVAAAACLLIVLTGTLMLSDFLNRDQAQPGPDTLIPNPVTAAASADELSGLVGFEVTDLADLPFEPDSIDYSAIADLAQIQYRTGDQTVVYRKGIGNEDVSGDFNSYEQTETVDVNGVEIKISGSNEVCNLATWTNDGFSYSISFSEGIKNTDLLEIIAGVS